MSSFEETLFKAMLPMFERALHSAANEAAAPAAPALSAPGKAVPAPAATIIPTGIPKAA